MEVPSWLSEQFLTTILEQHHKEKVSEVKFTVRAASAPGNNYLSDVFRVRVEYLTASGHPSRETIIAKAPAQTAFTTELAQKVHFFNKEPILYETLFPRMLEKVNCEFAPKYYPCPVPDLLVLKDLNEEGYFMSNRVNQLDYLHCLKVLTTVAKFHAASVAAHHEDPGKVRALGKEIIFTSGGPVDNEMKLGIESSVKKVTEIVKHLENCKEFHEVLLKRVDHMVQSVADTFRARKDKLNVLNHGDLWTTNILFRHDASGTVQDVKFIDYQLTRLCSPAFDLIFFVWSSADNNVREHKQKELFRAYLQTLNQALIEAGCQERMTEEQLQEDLQAAADFALIMVCHMLPVFVADPEDGLLKLDDINPPDKPVGYESETSKRLFNGKYFRGILPNIARQFLLSFPNFLIDKI